MKPIIAATALSLMAATAHADPVCYRLEPYFDRLKISFLPPSNGAQQFIGTWAMPGVYSMPITGTRAGQRLSVFGANLGKGYFLANVNCAIAGNIGGTWVAGCAGGHGPGFRIDDSDQPPEFPTRIALVACDAPMKKRVARGWTIGGMGELP